MRHNKVAVIVMPILIICIVAFFLLSSESSTADKVQPQEINTKWDITQGVPILMYHEIAEGNLIQPSKTAVFKKDMAVTPDEFRTQMQYLKDNNYNTITYEDLYDFMVNGKSLLPKSIVVSFDDGYLSNYSVAYPILKELGMKAEISVITGAYARDRVPGIAVNPPHFDWEQALQTQQSGVIDLASHTITHMDLLKLDDAQLQNELTGSKQSMEKHLNKNIFTIVYPFGRYDDRVISEAKSAGYKMGVTTQPGLNYYMGDVMRIKRFSVLHGDKIEQIMQKIEPR